jgi:hypothetical protein
MDTEQLAELILPWAREHHREKYDATLRVATLPESFRRFLLRLIEIRCTEDPAWRNTVPLAVLNDTSIRVTVRTKTGRTLRVGGREAPNIHLTFGMLASFRAQPDTFPAWLDVQDSFDLEVVKPA